MTSPGWMRGLLARRVPRGKADDAVGDLEESYAARRLSHGRVQALLLTAVAALEMAAALVGERRAPLERRRRHDVARDGRHGNQPPLRGDLETTLG